MSTETLPWYFAGLNPFFKGKEGNVRFFTVLIQKILRDIVDWNGAWVNRYAILDEQI